MHEAVSSRLYDAVSSKLKLKLQTIVLWQSQSGKLNAQCPTVDINGIAVFSLAIMIPLLLTVHSELQRLKRALLGELLKRPAAIKLIE